MVCVFAVLWCGEVVVLCCGVMVGRSLCCVVWYVCCAVVLYDMFPEGHIDILTYKDQIVAPPLAK
jgi:hypothetical protein